MHTNQRLLVDELIRRGARVRMLDPATELIEASFEGRTELILDRAGTSVSLVSSVVAADKHLSKQVLSAIGISTPEGSLFAPAHIDEAIRYGSSLGFPLVAKPNVGSGGLGAHSGIAGPDQLDEAICSLLLEAGSSSHFIVERMVDGPEFRVFITTTGEHAVLLREPASVVGDGRNSIERLALAESARRSSHKASQPSALCPLALDAVALNFLLARGLTPQSIPQAGQRVALRLGSNLSRGGVSQDMTDLVHPSVVEVAKKILSAFPGLPCLGIDLIAKSISEPLSDANPYAIIEVNANPGLAMHHTPAQGSPRDVARMLAQASFGGLFGHDTHPRDS